ncbi:MAG: xanthine dehydrogenase family protein subunit M [Acidobacteria bacterium]|nr:MAG: xanthine dehydrogenase family protein subunit M [Acidobacteriota bacterium]
MAVIRDTMAEFDLFQPASIDDALALKRRYGKTSWALAGGLDSLDWFKDRIKRPEVVIDLSAVESMRGIRETDDADGVEIGAMTTLTEVAEHAGILSRFGLLADAASKVATPQIRNQGTIGGNVTQDTRCWYYRGGWPCYRAGGNICYADTPTAINREHALFESNRCVAVNPSDTAPALVALDAKFVIMGGGGEKVVDAEDYFITPAKDITRMTILEPGELLTSIRIPGTWAGARFYFEKVRDRQAWDFPLVNIASAMKVSGNTIEDIRLVVNAVGPRPLRLTDVERQLKGQSVTEEVGQAAGELALLGARPLQHNAYKIPLMRNLVKRAIRGTGARA